MAVGFYVSVIRGRRAAWLLGPYDSHEEAKGKVADGRRLAEIADPFCCFDSFGTVRVEAETLRPGVLNCRLKS